MPQLSYTRGETVRVAQLHSDGGWVVVPAGSGLFALADEQGHVFGQLELPADEACAVGAAPEMASAVAGLLDLLCAYGADAKDTPAYRTGFNALLRARKGASRDAVAASLLGARERGEVVPALPRCVGCWSVQHHQDLRPYCELIDRNGLRIGRLQTTVATARLIASAVELRSALRSLLTALACMELSIAGRRVYARGQIQLVRAEGTVQ